MTTDNSKVINVKTLIEKYDLPFFENSKKVYKKYDIIPKMTAILTSDDPGSKSYIRGIKRFCKKNDISFESFFVTSKEELEETIVKLNKSNTDGIMVMYPANFGVKDTYFMNLVDPDKDVEGLHFSHLGYLVQFEKFKDAQKLRKFVIPPTAKGIMYLFKRYNLYYEEYKEEHGKYPDNADKNPFVIEGKKITIINDSIAVGRSLSLMMLNENGSVQICHEYTKFEDTLNFIKKSDIIISAVPSSKFTIPTDVVPKDATVIDISFEGNFEYPSIIDKVYKIAPKWDLVEKGNRINDMTLYRLISNLFYLINSKMSDDVLEEIE